MIVEYSRRFGSLRMPTLLKDRAGNREFASRKLKIEIP